MRVGRDAAPMRLPVGDRQSGDAAGHDRDVELARVGGEPPLNAAAGADFEQVALPEDLAAGVRIEGIDHARFLPGKHKLLAAGQGPQQRRAAEIHVGSHGVRAIADARGADLARGLAAIGEEIIRLRQLQRPFADSRRHVERQDGVRAVGRGIRIGIAGADIEKPAPRVDRRRGPDGGAGRAKQLLARGVALKGPRRLADGVAFAERSAVGRVKRNHAAAELAAFVIRLEADPLLARRDGDIESLAIQHRRPGDPRQRMILDPPLPQWLPRRRIDGMDDSLQVAEIDRRAALRRRQGTDADRRPHTGTRIDHPIAAAGPSVQRIDPAFHIGDEDATADDGRLRVGRRTAIAEGPAEPEPRDILGLKAGVGLIARVLGIAAPAVPLRRGEIDGRSGVRAAFRGISDPRRQKQEREQRMGKQATPCAGSQRHHHDRHYADH